MLKYSCQVTAAATVPIRSNVKMRQTRETNEYTATLCCTLTNMPCIRWLCIATPMAAVPANPIGIDAELRTRYKGLENACKS